MQKDFSCSGHMFLQVLYEILNKLVKPDCRFILTGDLNIDSYTFNNDFDCLANVLKCFNLDCEMAYKGY